MTYNEWWRETTIKKIYDIGNSPLYQAAKEGWNAALKEAIDEIRAHITVDDQVRMDIAINNLKGLIDG